MACQLCPREMFNVALKSPEQGGFDGVRDADGDVIMSETSMMRRWPNWIAKISPRFTATCVCDGCGVPSEVQISLNMKRRKIVKALRATGENMRAGRGKNAFMARLKKYDEKIMDGENSLRYNRMSDVINAVTCEPIEINGEKLHKFACVLGKCDECKDSYKPFAYEAECVEYIKYCLYNGHHQCT